MPEKIMPEKIMPEKIGPEKRVDALTGTLTSSATAMQMGWWTVKTQLLLSVGLISALLLLVVVVGYFWGVSLTQRFERVTQDIPMEFEKLGDIRVLTRDLSGKTQEYVLFGEEEAVEAWGKTWGELTAALKAYAAAREAQEATSPEEKVFEEELIEHLQAEITNLEARAAEMIALREARAGEGELTEAGEALREAEVAVETVLEEAEITLDEELSEETTSLGRTMNQMRMGMVVIPLVIAGVIVFRASGMLTGIIKPLRDLERVAHRITEGDLELTAEVKHADEIGVLADTFNRMTAQLRNSIGELEQQNQQRARRSRYMEATARVARDAATVLNLQQVLPQVARLVSGRFGFYHVGVFLLDQEKQWATLQAASSEGGQRMLARGHRLRIGEGIVGNVVEQGRPRVVMDVGGDAVYFDNPDLPETRSEIALPLRSRGEIIGVLDVQSTEAQAFSDEDVDALQMLADLVAVAISNARLFQRTQELLEAERRAYGQLSRRRWQDLLRQQSGLGCRFDPKGILPRDGAWRGEMRLAEQRGETVLDGSVRAAAVPIKVRGHVIGVIDALRTESEGEWTQDQVDLLEVLAEQLGLALESARLYRDTQLLATRERMLGEVTGRVRESLDMESVLRTAVDQVQQVLGLDKVAIRLATRETDGDSA
jgi:GAF domain-containing protein/HAMP domain-containing protein